MAKTVNNPKEKMRMNIELADNGIIIRNPDCEDEVTLAMSHDNGMPGLGYEQYHDDEYKAIGRKIYDWIMDMECDKHCGDLIITNFDIDIVATCKGRDFK